MRSLTRIVAEALAGGGTRYVELTAPAPLSLRETPDGLFLVGSAQSLLADDELEIEIEVGEGAEVQIRSVAATIAYASNDARFSIRARVERGGSLNWRPEPLIATSRCRLDISASVELEEGSNLDWTEECVLGRVAEEPGDLDLSLSVNYAGLPALRHQLVVGTGLAGWDGPAVLGQSRAVALRVAIDGRDGSPRVPAPASEPNWAVMPLDAGGATVTALGADLIELRAALAEANVALERSWDPGRAA